VSFELRIRGHVGGGALHGECETKSIARLQLPRKELLAAIVRYGICKEEPGCGVDVTLIGCSLKPVSGRSFILWHAFAANIKASKVVLSVDIALLGSLSPLLECVCVVSGSNSSPHLCQIRSRQRSTRTPILSRKELA
jgi:hypothetical protein